MTLSVKPNRNEILELIGSIILATQETERSLKLIQSFTNNTESSLSSALLRHKKLSKQTFGQLVGEFKASSVFTSNDIIAQLDLLVNRRNNVVHHFHETFSSDLVSGNTNNVILALREHQTEISALRDMLGQMALRLFEAIRDTTFKDTPEFADMDAVCSALQKNVAI